MNKYGISFGNDLHRPPWGHHSSSLFTFTFYLARRAPIFPGRTTSVLHFNTFDSRALPAGLADTGDLALVSQFSEADTADAVLAKHRVRTAAQAAASVRTGGELGTVNTRNILFICGGAFPDLEEIIKQRLSKQTSIGFNAELKDSLDKEKNILKKVKVEDIKKFGMIPEFVGRLPIICPMDGLDKDSYIQILQEPKNAILKQYQKLLELDEVKLSFDSSALEAIAEKAMERDTGARALRAIIEEFMLDIMYEIPKDENIGEVTITGDYINGTGGPVIQIRTESVHPKKIEEQSKDEKQEEKQKESKNPEAENFLEF